MTIFPDIEASMLKRKRKSSLPSQIGWWWAVHFWNAKIFCICTHLMISRLNRHQTANNMSYVNFATAALKEVKRSVVTLLNYVKIGSQFLVWERLQCRMIMIQRCHILWDEHWQNLKEKSCNSVLMRCKRHWDSLKVNSSVLQWLPVTSSSEAISKHSWSNIKKSLCFSSTLSISTITTREKSSFFQMVVAYI